MNYLLLAFLMVLVVVLTSQLIRKKARSRKPIHHSTAVHEQHIHLFQGGQISESQVESARAAIETQLQSDGTEGVLTALKPGIGFAVQVQALAQIGTRNAIEILEEQLRRSITSHPPEQAWYWLDITRALRLMDWNECLPLLFACVGKAPAPLNQFLSAEAVCFSGFIELLQSRDCKTRRGAVRLLQLALLGLRSGVQPHVVVSGRLGEAVVLLWECRWEEFDPAAVRVFHESLRLLQRGGHLERLLADDEMRARLQEQIQAIDLLAEPLADWLQDARVALPQQLKLAPAEEQADLLRAAIDLRADTAAVVQPLLEANRLQTPELAIQSLAFTKQSGIGDWLCEWANEQVAQGKWRPWRKADKLGKSVYLSVLQTLRHLPCRAAERFLVNATSNHDRAVQTAAFGSLGWWEPLDLDAVVRCLQDGRCARSFPVQAAAQAALARLGERQALQWFRRQLAAESSDWVHHVLDQIAQEGIVLLWPDLDHLADAEDDDVAHHACETLELMREDIIFSA